MSSNTYEELEKAYEIELDRIENSIGKQLTQEVYDNELEKLNEDDYYTITFIRQAADTALEEICDVEISDDRHGYVLFIGGKYFGLYDTMIKAKLAFEEIINSQKHTFKVPIFPSIIPLMNSNDRDDADESDHADDYNSESSE